MLKWLIIYAILSCTAVYLYLNSMTADTSGWCSPWEVVNEGCVDSRGVQ